MKTRNSLTKTAILALTIALGTLSSVSLAQAEIINNDIKVTKSELKGKCERSGGTYTEDADGSYGCIINYDDGSITVVACDDPNDCFGYTDTAKERPLRGGSIRPEAMVNDVAEYTPISVTRYTPISVTRYTPISVVPTKPALPRLTLPMKIVRVVR